MAAIQLTVQEQEALLRKLVLNINDHTTVEQEITGRLSFKLGSYTVKLQREPARLEVYLDSDSVSFQDNENAYLQKLLEKAIEAHERTLKRQKNTFLGGLGIKRS